jgi:4-hydroxybenzoate polyprenyltransferase
MEVSETNPVIRFFRLIRFSHTIFALPFALGALLVAANGRPSLRVLGLVLLCMVLARTAAMLFNRLSDWSLDQKNPRTATRHLLIKKPLAWGLLAISSAGFLIASAAINRAAALLSPVALAIVFFYSLTKRFTGLTHFFLGLALAVAPAGAWIHLIMFAALIAFGLAAKLGAIYFAAMVLIAGALVYEHRSARKLDLAGINRAFFQSNAFVSVVFVAAVAADRCL